MEDRGGMRLARLDDRSRQNRHRLRHTPLLAGRKVSLKGFTSKKGSKFDASLVVDKDRGVIFDFGSKH